MTRIVALGDRDPQYLTHREIDAALALMPADVDAGWVATDAPEARSLDGAAAVWLLPGTPYRDEDAAFAAIEHCLETGTPFLGTCGGFQYACVHLARRFGADARHAETEPDADDPAIVPLACSLYGETREVTPVAGTRLAAICRGRAVRGLPLVRLRARRLDRGAAPGERRRRLRDRAGRRRGGDRAARAPVLPRHVVPAAGRLRRERTAASAARGAARRCSCSHGVAAEPTYNSPVTRRRWISVGLVAAVLGLVVSGCDKEKPTVMQPTSAAEGLAACVNAGEDTIRDCYAAALKDLVENAEDPLAAVDAITEEARKDPGGFLLPNCHGLMHTVGREYARDHDLTVAALKDSLPKSNDPGCPAGYAHGLVTGVAPQIDPRDPKASAVGLRRLGHALRALQLHPRVRARVHADLERGSRGRAGALREARQELRSRLRAGRLPRLLVLGRRLRRHAEAERRRDRPEQALRRAEARVRAPVLVPRLRGQPPAGIDRERARRRPPLPGPRRAAARGLHHRRRR